ncbi:MAG: tol-pal system protein YbgF [bacterium]
MAANRKGTRILRSFLLMILLSMTLSVLTQGCSSQNRLRAYQAETDNLKRELRFIKEENVRLRRELDAVKKRLEEQAVNERQTRADLLALMDELRQQVEITQNQLAESNTRMSTFSQTISARDQNWEAGSFQRTSTDSTDSTSSSGNQRLGLDESRELYNTAYGDLIRGNYQLALHGFNQFLQRYPNSDLSDNAQYWTGEIYYAQGRFSKSVEEFEKVIKWYPNGDKVPSALLKIGYAYINLEEPEQGKLYLEEVVREHPNSQEAKLAQGRLQSLKF